MRLKFSKVEAEERLLPLLNAGYELRQFLWSDYVALRNGGIYDITVDYKRHRGLVDEWLRKVISELNAIFPSPLESNKFNDRWSWASVDYQNMDDKFGRLYYDTIPTYIERLQKIIECDIPRYTDLPIKERLFVEDIDSFRKVRDVNRAMVSNHLNEGRLERFEDDIQLAFEQILDVPFHKKDWGGEQNDLYSANVIVNGRRTDTAFLLKGKGCTNREMQIADCGKNGDQLLRLFNSPARLLVVQYIGPISEAVVADVLGKVRERRTLDKDCNFLILDGQDTARLLLAYGKL